MCLFGGEERSCRGRSGGRGDPDNAEEMIPERYALTQKEKLCHREGKKVSFQRNRWLFKGCYRRFLGRSDKWGNFLVS